MLLLSLGLIGSALPLAMGAACSIKSSTIAASASTSVAPTTTVSSSADASAAVTSIASTVVSASASAASASASSNSSTLTNCTIYTTGAPFNNASADFDGFVNLYGVSKSAAEGGRVISSRNVILGVGSDGTTVQACYDDDVAGCEAQLFSFEACVTQDSYTSYGHLIYRASASDPKDTQCLAASNSSAINGSSLVLTQCNYDLTEDTAFASGQWFLIQYEVDAHYVYLTTGVDVAYYGPNADITTDGTNLTLFETDLDGTTGTYFTFNTTSS